LAIALGAFAILLASLVLRIPLPVEPQVETLARNGVER